MIVLLLEACSTSGTPLPSDGHAGVDLTVTKVPTVYKATWDTATASVGSLLYGEGETLDHVAAAVDSDEGRHHEVRVALAAGTTWSWQIANDGLPDQGGSVDVIAAPEGIPTFTLTEGEGSPTGGYVVGASPAAGEGTAVWILDSWGRPVWWSVFDKPEPMATEARLSTDGLWLEWVRGVPGHAFHRRKLDGSRDEDFEVDEIHHSFIQMPEGGWTVLIEKLGEINGQAVIGQGLVALDTEGNSTEIFDSWDAMEIDTSDGQATPAGMDSIHDNGLFYDEATDRFLVSSFARNSVFAVNRSDGSVAWELGGNHSDYTLRSGTPFVEQHGPSLDANGDLLLFDNGGQDRLASRAVGYTFDEEALTYTQAWEWGADPSVYAAVFGNPERLPDGDLFVNWGSAGRLEILDADFNVTWRLDGELGSIVGYAHPIPTLLGSPG